MDSEVSEASRGTPGARGRALWLATLLVGILALVIQGYGINSWPMADDEVPSLVEMGLIKVDPQAFSVPANQIGRLPRAVPVFYRFQRFAIDHLPKSEVSYRLPSLVFGVLTSILAFFVAARWRGLWFAAALAIVMNGSQLFVYLAQLDRFYALPVLLLTATLILMWLPGAVVYVAIAVLTALAVLSHNVTLVVFGLAFGASVLLYLFRQVPLDLPLKSGLAVAVSGAIYVFYLLPIVRGWNSTGNPTPVLVSFTAQLGVPILALALLGGWFILTRRDSVPVMWTLLMFVAGVCTLVLPVPIQWNPRYFIFFFPATWVLSAYAMEFIARRLGLSLTGAAWYAVVILLLAPSMLSHYVDGTRHNYRDAAEILVQRDPAGDPILSDDAETISYYLPESLKHNLFVRTKVTHLPESTFYLVARMNAWAPLPVVPGRQMHLLGEISHRRFDQFSHILRVYRVDPAS